jgi:hypothetical protein
MPFQVSPGVNVSEIDLTTVVPAVSTTEGGFAGQFRWGPANTAVLVDSEDRLVNIFQKPNSDNATDFFTAANFLAYGNALNVVRVVGSGALNAAESTAALIENEDSTIPTTDNFYAKYAGVLGNSLKVSVCPDATAWQSTVSLPYAISRNSDQLAITSANTAQVTAAFNVGDIVDLGPSSDKRKIQTIGSSANATHVIITLESKYSGADASGSSVVRNWEFSGNFDEAPTTTTNGTALGATGDEIHIVVADEDGLITGTKNAVLESYASVSLGTDAKTEQGAINHFADVINQQSAYIAASTKALLGSTTLSGTTFSTGGVVRNSSLVNGADGSNITSENKIIGYDHFASAEDIDISFLLGGDANATLATHLITNIAESRKDCIAVLSPERADVVKNNSYAGKERDDIIAFRDTLPSSSYAVLDSGWKYQYDKYNDVYRYVPLNADTAGLMVQTDLTRDPWFSPAGYNRGNVKNAIKLAYNPSKGDRDQLYKKGINPVVTFPGQGTVLFGDKTLLSKPSAFDRINVRRLFIVLEKAISTASKFTLFEFNDEFTRSQFTNLVVPFLRDVQGRRGITDFQVVCDSTNNTGEVIDRNEFVGDIYIKPARSINFIQLNFVAVRSGVEFSEIVGRA